MASKVVSLEKIRLERQYMEFHQTTLNLALDSVYKPAKRDIKKQMIKGYLSLLSNLQHWLAATAFLHNEELKAITQQRGEKMEQWTMEELIEVKNEWKKLAQDQAKEINLRKQYESFLKSVIRSGETLNDEHTFEWFCNSMIDVGISE